MARDRGLQVSPGVSRALSGAQPENPEPEQPPGFPTPSWGLYKQSAKSGKKNHLRVIVQEKNFGQEGSNPGSVIVKLDVFGENCV